MASPVEEVLFDVKPGQDWHMQYSERAALLYIINRLKPDISIEIGTFRCGSLSPISAASRDVYTFDIDPNQHRASPLFSNVTFVTGDSALTVPPIIDEINDSDREVNFILVDGSHEEEGVRLDLVQCLRYRPKSSPTVIMMHDSSNPVVRRGIERAPWNDCPFVHELDLDFVPGMLYDRPDINGQIWGGLGIAIMLPTARKDDLIIRSTFEHSRSVLMEHSIY